MTFSVFGTVPQIVIPDAQTLGGIDTHGSAGDPVDTFSGAFNYASGTDLRIRTGDGDITVARRYASNDTTPGPFGVGWTFPYDEYLTAGA